MVEMLVHNMQYFFSLEYDIQGFKAKGSHVKSLEALENIQLADDDHHVLCILCNQLSQNKKTFIKVGGQVGTQGLRNHLRGAHPQAWRDIGQEERDEKKAKKKSELKNETTPKIDDAFSNMVTPQRNRLAPQQV